MSRHKNADRFKITGDKKVRVTVEFDMGSAGGDKLAMKIAQDYLGYFAASGNHKSFGYQIDVEHNV